MLKHKNISLIEESPKYGCKEIFLAKVVNYGEFWNSECVDIMAMLRANGEVWINTDIKIRDIWTNTFR